MSNHEAGPYDRADLDKSLDAGNSDGAALKAGFHGQNCSGGRAELLSRIASWLGDIQNRSGGW